METKTTKSIKGTKERDLIQFHHNRKEPIKWGYARVSSKDQNLDRQLEALKSAGVNEEYIITDKESGKDFQRAGYIQLKRFLKAGDILVIKEIDRLGRDYTQTKEEWQEIIKMGVDIEVIETPILNTAGQNDSIKQLIGNITFEVLMYQAQAEREKITQRRKEGQKIAKEKGIKFGRPTNPKTEEGKKIAVDLYLNTNYTVKQILEMAKISKRTFYLTLKEQGIKSRAV